MTEHIGKFVTLHLLIDGKKVERVGRLRTTLSSYHYRVSGSWFNTDEVQMVDEDARGVSIYARRVFPTVQATFLKY